jgi:hypothetical protein
MPPIANETARSILCTGNGRVARHGTGMAPLSRGRDDKGTQVGGKCYIPRTSATQRILAPSLAERMEVAATAAANDLSVNPFES